MGKSEYNNRKQLLLRDRHIDEITSTLNIKQYPSPSAEEMIKVRRMIDEHTESIIKKYLYGTLHWPKTPSKAPGANGSDTGAAPLVTLTKGQGVA